MGNFYFYYNTSFYLFNMKIMLVPLPPLKKNLQINLKLLWTFFFLNTGQIGKPGVKALKTPH
jgi:hypothetical protein